jgi:heterodisulfide reductase subunit B
MNYSYYPGCSLTASAREYDVSTRAVLARLGAGIEEIPDWTCCGASAVETVSPLLTLALPARNLALAEALRPGGDVLAPCSACYLNLLRVLRQGRDDKRLRSRVGEVLAAGGLSFGWDLKVRHLLDVLATDFGPQAVAGQVRHPLTGLLVAPYYGCQALRPYPLFDDPERPRSMEALIRALGAEVLDWDLGGRCCGASLMATKPEVALASVAAILSAAREADVIVTVCPMCQMNLEAYQSQALGPGQGVATVLYLPQLMGLAFGLSERDVLLEKNMAVRADFPGLVRPAREAPASPAG